jgi:hypothetical protein
MSKTTTEATRAPLALTRCTRILNALDENARTRLLAYLIGRYVPGRFRYVVDGVPVVTANEDPLGGER